MLIDGNSLVYRAFFALPTDMATASGQITNAVFGFTSMLINLWRDHDPDQIIVAFDRPEPTFRHAKIPDYKATRDSAPDILRQQMGLVRELLDVLAIPTVDVAGYEADDIIATLAATGRDRGDDVIIVTGDRDVYQLVEDPHLKVLYNRRGVSDYKLYDEAGIRERTGVHPRHYVQYAALRGDPSDNLPGVAGVGEKTAAKLINDKGGLDAIFASLDDLTPKLRESLAAAEAQVRSNAEVMKLIRDAPLEASLENLTLGDVNAVAVRKLFDFLEFHTLHKRLVELQRDPLRDERYSDSGASQRALTADVLLLNNPQQALQALKDAASEASAHKRLVLAAPSGGLEVGLAWVVDADKAHVAFLPGELLSDAEVCAALATLVGIQNPQSNTSRPIAVHDGKALMRPLLDRGVEMRDPLIDTMLAAYLLDPANARYELSDVAERYADIEPSVLAVSEGRLNFDGDSTNPAQEAGWAALAVERLVEPLSEALTAQGLNHLNDDVEVPLVRVLARMEQAGIAVDRAVLLQRRADRATEGEKLHQ